MVNLRGTIVPLVDMRIKFNLGTVEYNQFTVVIILTIGERVVGMLVDGVSDVITLNAEQVNPGPDFSTTFDSEYITGLGTVDERMLILVDIERLMGSSDMALEEPAALQEVALQLTIRRGAPMNRYLKSKRQWPAAGVRSMIVRLCAVAISVNAACAYSAHPLATEDTGTQGQGGWQLEVNAEVTRDKADGTRTRGFQPAATFSYGVVETLDIQLGRPYLRQTRDDGATRTESNGGLDTSLDFKWRFFEHDGFSLGLKPGVTFATGRDEFGRGTGKTTFGSLLIASFDQDGYALHAHLGVRRNNNDVNQRRMLYQAAIAGMLKLHETTRVIVDLSTTTNPDPTDSTAIRYATLGVIYSPRKNIDLDLGWRFGISGPAIDRSLLFGATLRW